MGSSLSILDASIQAKVAYVDLADFVNNSAKAQAALQELPGWSVVTNYSKNGVNSNGSVDLDTQFIVLVNASSKKITIAFRGSANAENFASDLTPADGGYTQWLKLKTGFRQTLGWIRSWPGFQGYEIATTGHSLGGLFSQLASLDGGLSGFGVNFLGINTTAMIGEFSSPGTTGIGYNQSVINWKLAGNTFVSANSQYDIATGLYRYILNERYLDTTTYTAVGSASTVDLALSYLYSKDLFLKAILAGGRTQ